MKTTVNLLMFILAFLVLSSCDDKKENEDLYFYKYVKVSQTVGDSVFYGINARNGDEFAPCKYRNITVENINSGFITLHHFNGEKSYLMENGVLLERPLSLSGLPRINPNQQEEAEDFNRVVTTITIGVIAMYLLVDFLPKNLPLLPISKRMRKIIYCLICISISIFFYWLWVIY